MCICTTQNSVSIERDRKIFARLVTKKKDASIVSKNKRKTNGNFTSDSWTAKNRRNRSHAEVKNYLLFATKLSRPVKKTLDKDFNKKKIYIYIHEAK